MTMTRRTLTKTALSTAALVATGTTAKAADVDVIVIGAGAAGLSATDALRRAGLTVHCIEATDRIGGRVFTDTETFGVPFDHGAHWLHHKALNPFIDIGKSYGLTLYQQPDDLQSYIKGRGRTPDQDALINAEHDRMFEALKQSARAGNDLVATYIRHPKTDWTLTGEAMIGSLSMARDLEDVSDLDWYIAEEGEDWFCAQGFGALIARHWADVPVTLNTPVTSIDADSDTVTVHTKNGTLSAKAAIVTVSQGVLANESFDIRPTLDADLAAAISDITLGSYNHIALQFEKGVIETPPDTWVAYQLTERHNGSPKGGAILANSGGTGLCYFEIGGGFGRWLEAQGEKAMVDFALSEMRDIFGPHIISGFIKGHATRWGHVPTVLGSYSGTKPGKALVRSALRTPIADRIFLAGEATSIGEQGTVSGAHKEGLRAAETVVELLS